MRMDIGLQIVISFISRSNLNERGAEFARTLFGGVNCNWNASEFKVSNSNLKIDSLNRFFLARYISKISAFK